MKDPNYTGSAIPLAYRFHFEAQFQFTTDTREGDKHGNIKFSRASESNMATLRSLPEATNILLFTPVIIPAGYPGARKHNRAHGDAIQHCLDGKQAFESAKIRMAQTKKPRETVTMDPFEAFGRALSFHHRRIRHVPYVAGVGFTDTHDDFVSEADAVITVVCEPDIDKDNSVSDQMNFAEETLDSIERKESCAANALVLVQAGSSQYRLPIDAMFENVVECQNYNEETAKSIAHTIFDGEIPNALY